MKSSTDRASNVRGLLVANDLDALIVTDPTNIRYVSGFTGSNGKLIVQRDAITLFTDARYIGWATAELEAHGAPIELAVAPATAARAIEGLLDDAGTIGLEADHVSWTQAKSMSTSFGSARVSATSGLIEGLRERKDENEVAQLRAAAEIGDRALAALIPTLDLGMSEQQIARQLAQHMYNLAGALPSFDIIVASGPNSARPHHSPGKRRLETGDLLIIDSGATVDGYRSDMTRTFVLGQPSSAQQELLDVVLVAQQAGVDAVRAGVAASEIDAVCRSSITDSGYGEFFTHGTGHGVGLDIHEAPSVSSSSTATLAPGHIITVEPGVYIPDLGGVRWEDTVVVMANGADPLTRSPKQPIVEL